MVVFMSDLTSGDVAVQWAARRTCNQVVVGSTPGALQLGRLPCVCHFTDRELQASVVQPPVGSRPIERR